MIYYLLLTGKVLELPKKVTDLKPSSEQLIEYEDLSKCLGYSRVLGGHGRCAKICDDNGRCKFVRVKPTATAFHK